MNYKKSDGEETTSAEVYIKSWNDLTRPVERAFELQRYAFDPDAHFRTKEGGIVELPPWFLVRLNELLVDFKASTDMIGYLFEEWVEGFYSEEELEELKEEFKDSEPSEKRFLEETLDRQEECQRMLNMNRLISEKYGFRKPRR